VREAACTSLETLTEALATVVQENPNQDDLQFLLLVYSVRAGCNLMLRAWERDSGLREGFAWDIWVDFIAGVVEYYGLPSSVRKDSDKRDPDLVNSQFVLLIKKLQEHLPEELRRHNQSNEALEQAIHRARKSDRWTDLVPQRIREKFAEFLETPEQRAERFDKFKQDLRNDPDWIEMRPGSFKRIEIVRLGSEQKVEPEERG
jgi:hypothetical protein